MKSDASRRRWGVPRNFAGTAGCNRLDSAGEDGRLKVLLWGLVGLGSLWRFGMCLWHPPTAFLFSDPKRHWLNAERLFTPGVMGASDPILYQVYLRLLRGLTADDPQLLGIVCGLLSVATAWAFYRAAREMGLSSMEALIFYVAVTWTPSLVVIFHYFMAETLLLFAVAVSLWMTARHLRKRALSSFLTAIFAWTLACLTKASVAPLAVVCIVYVWAMVLPRHPGWLVAGGAVVTLLLIPNAIRTHHYLGFVAPLGSAWIPVTQHQADAKTIRIHWKEERLQFSSPSCYEAPLEPLSPWMIERARTEKTVDIYANPQQGEEDWRRARAAAVQPGWSRWLQRAGENTLLFLFASSWPDSDPNLLEGELNLWLRWMWGVLILRVLWGNAIEFLRGRWQLIPLATTAFTLFLMFQWSVTMEGRYRKPLEPLLLMNLIWLQSLRRQCRDES